MHSSITRRRLLIWAGAAVSIGGGGACSTPPAVPAEVAAGVKQQLQADAARLGGLRLLPGRFMVIEQAMGVQAGRGAPAEQLLRAFVEQAKASGFVAQALGRHGIQGALVAPATPPG